MIAKHATITFLSTAIPGIHFKNDVAVWNTNLFLVFLRQKHPSFPQSEANLFFFFFVVFLLVFFITPIYYAIFTSVFKDEFLSFYLFFFLLTVRILVSTKMELIFF